MYHEGDVYAVPVLPAYEIEQCLIAWCRYCGTWHTHERAEGYHPAQCEAETPYTETGYFLVCMGTYAELVVLADDDEDVI